MIEMTVHIEGMREIQTALRSMLPDRTARNVMKRVLMARAQPIAESIRMRAPKRTGRLKISVGAGTKLSRSQSMQYRKVNPDDVEIFIGAGPLPQAHMVEFGTSKMRAEPYIRPAWDGAKSTLLENIGADMWNEIQKAVGRIARKAARG